MDNWPNIPLPSSCPSGVRDPLLEDEFQSGDDAARPQFAAPRCMPVTLTWNWLHKDDLATLRSFQKAHRASLFLWTDPFSGELWEARFSGEEPVKWSPIAKLPDHAQVTATIKPVNEVVLPPDAPVTKRKPSYILSADIGLSGEIVERASEQTYRREDGSLGTMPPNTLVPTVKNGRKCFEIYEQRTDDLLWSSDFSNPVWISGFCDVNEQGFLVPEAPDPQVHQTHNLLENTTYTFSIEARADVPHQAQLFILQDSPWQVVTNPNIMLTDEWQLFEVTFTTAEAGKYSMRFDGDQNGALTSQWRDPQLEKGKGASPRIPTTDSPKTRPATSVAQPTGNWFNLNEGTFVIEFEKIGLENSRVLFSLGTEFTGSLYASVGTNGVNFFHGGMGGGVGGSVANGTVRLAAKYTPTSLSLAINGGGVTTDLVNVSSENWEELYIGRGSWGSGSFLNSSFSDIIYYPEAVTDEELKAFSEVRHA